MKIPKLCRGLLTRIVLLSIVAVSFFAQDLVAQRLSVTPATLPQATRGESYNQSFSATGGVAPYSWKISGLPPGVKAEGSTISGTPTTTGSFSVTVEVTDNTK